MNTQFATNVHTFTGEVLDLLFEQFEGKRLSGDGEEDSVTKEELMESLFGDYKPGKAVKVKKGKKKSSSGSKKKKRLSGYTFFGAMNKEEVNEEIKKIESESGEKPKYVSIVGKKWKALSEEGQSDWNLSAKAYNLFIEENEGSEVSAWKELSSSDKKSWNKKAKEAEDEKDEK